MTPNRLSITCLFLLSTILTVQVNAQENWGHWRGPVGNGISESATPPTQWSDSLNVKWKVAIPGKGSGSPIVWENKVFVVTAVSEAADGAAQRPRGRRRGGAPPTKTSFEIMCFDRESGKQLWKQVAAETTPHQGVHPTNNFASASPCTDGKHVYASFGSRGVHCYTLDGEFVWKRDDFGEMNTRAGFGEGASPTIVGDKIIVPWDHEGQSAVYALNKSTGETIWKTDRDEPTNWSTPLVVGEAGAQQVVLNGQTCVRSYDLETGKELWRCAGQTQRPCATAVAGMGMVFVGSGHRGAYLGAFKLDGKDNIENSESVAWSINRDAPDIASPLLSENRLFFHKGKTGMVSCLNAETGEAYFTASRIPGVSSTYASPVAAGGFVFLTGRSGNTTVIKDAEKLEVVTTNSVGETVDATPALVGNQIFIRGEKHLFCISEE